MEAPGFAEAKLSLRDIAVGLVAGAIAVAAFHQSVILAAYLAGITPSSPWSLRPIQPLGVPHIVSQMFWGGLWGILFGVLWPLVPGRQYWQKGIVFSLIGPLLLGSWILVPLIKQTGGFFGGFSPLRLGLGLCLATAWGAGLGLLFGGVTRRA
jgi:hypothetical protein